jgi:hypothetical protein
MMPRQTANRSRCSAYFTGAAVAALLLLRVLPSPAQEVTGPALKASYIHNFVTFTKWPTDAFPGTAVSTFCVLGDAAVAEALERAVKGRLHAGHPITVSRVTPTASLRGCSVLYLSSIAAPQAVQILAAVRDLPVLTISDIEGFAELGGIVQLFYARGSLLFTVRVEPAKRARLELSSRLIILSKRP